MISVILPTLNEAENLPRLIPTIFAALSESGEEGEVIVVDDASPDGTAGVAEELARRYPVRVILREVRRGLASAVAEGIAHARGNLVGIMDADGSHDPRALPRLLQEVRNGAEVAVGSRYVPGGGTGAWPLARRLGSRTAGCLAFLLAPVRDPTSGYLVFRRSVLEDVSLSPVGFKIGLEILVKGRYTRVAEVPYHFSDRTRGSSKLGWRVALQYLRHLFLLHRHQLLHSPKRSPEGPTSEGGKSRHWIRLLLLLAFATMVATWRLGSAPLSDSEAFYAEAAREMFLRDDWTVPYFNFARFFDRPPLYYWMELVAYAMLGVGELSARLPAALAFVAIVGVTAGVGGILFDRATGLLAGLLLACTMGFYLYSHTVIAEPLLALWIAVALAMFYAWFTDPSRTGLLYAVYGAMGLSVLTKGLTGIVFPVLIIGGFLLLAGDRRLVKRAIFLPGVALFLLIVLPWHVRVATDNPGYLWFYVVHEHLYRFLNLRWVSDPMITTAPFLGTFLLLLFPWTLFLPQAVLAGFREWREGVVARPAFLYVMLWAGVIVGFFCAARHKLEYYSLPAWPAVALLVAHYWRARPARPGIGWGLVVLALLAAGGLGLLPWLRKSFAHELPHPWLAEGARLALWVLLGSALAALAAWRARRLPLALAIPAAVMLPIFAMAQHGVLLIDHYLSSATVARAARDCLARHEGAAVLVHEETDEDIFVGGVAFYTGRKVWLLKPAEAQRFPFPLTPEERFFLTPEGFARMWSGDKLVFFVGDADEAEGRPWDPMLGRKRSPFYRIAQDGSQDLIANQPACGVTKSFRPLLPPDPFSSR